MSLNFIHSNNLASLVTLHVLKFEVIWLNQKDSINKCILIVKNQVSKVVGQTLKNHYRTHKYI